MKFVLAETNTTPRDWEGNFTQIRLGIESAKQMGGVDAIVFPEAAICGYASKDLLYNKDFISNNLKYLQKVVDLTADAPDLKVFVGYFDRSHTGYGKPFKNMVAVIQNGYIEATYQKQLLPFYDVFDEGRYFEPGTDLTVVQIKGKKFGILICEDAWNDKNEDNYNYINNPVAKYRAIGINDFISLNSSPFVIGKGKKRRQMLENITADGGIFVYANQKGGQDELVFDGHSLIVQDGRTVFQAPSSDNSEATYFSFEVKGSDMSYNFTTLSEVSKGEDDKYGLLWKMLTLGLRDYIHKSGFKQAVVGSSGGIDSAVVLSLLCDAIGPENVHGIRMPSLHSSEGSVSDALELHKNLGCFDYLVPIDHFPWIDDIERSLSKQENSFVFDLIKTKKGNPVANENIQARMRGDIVMHFSNKFGALAITTGNKTELALGYCTLYGDMNGGFAPINDCLKMDVYALARWKNESAGLVVIPVPIIEKAPSAELAPGQKDEDSLGAMYPVLDLVVNTNVTEYINTFAQFKEFLDARRQDLHVQAREWIELAEAKANYARLIKMIERNEFKRRQAAPGLKVSNMAFGSGRRLPIVKK